MSEDINSLIQRVLKQSYDETSDDLTKYTEKVKFFNKAKENIRENINEYSDAMREFMKMKESGDLTKISTKQIEVINKFEKDITSIEKAIKGVKVPGKGKNKQIVSDIKTLRKNIKNKKLEIKIANPNISTIKLTPIQKLKYLKRKKR